MSVSEKEVNEEPRAHVDIQDDPEHAPHAEGNASPGMKNSKGWDGKLRVPKSALLSNPEALSDPEYSDDENVMDGEAIKADEG
jgi:protein phosphatase 1 regulatory subunit 7